MSRLLTSLVLILLSSFSLGAQSSGALRDTVSYCPSCDAWNASKRPFKLFGNTYYVGTHGLSAILLTSADGHVLLDGGLPQSAAVIIANIRALGFRIEDVRLILNSHAHYDHAGGIAALQRASGATVAASAWSASVLRTGAAQPGDPQLRESLRFPMVTNVRVIADGDTLRVGGSAVVAHFTGGHTPGGTSWAWRSCEGNLCRSFVYADSQTPISDDGFLYTASREYPTALEDYARGFETLERLSCDVLITPHPEAVDLFTRLVARDAGQEHAFVDAEACKRYASTARTRLAARVARERTGKP